MNKRERILVILISVLAVAFIGKLVIESYSESLDTWKNKVASVEKSKEKAVKEIRTYKDNQFYWTRIGEQTLTKDAATIGNLLREDLTQIAEQAGLREVVISPGGTRKWPRSKIQGADPRVTAEGRLENVLQFLYKVQSQPYFMRIGKLSLSPREVKDRNANKVSTTGIMDLRVTLETPVLPEEKDFPKFKPDPDNTQGPERFDHDTLEPYLARITPKLFSVWVPPPEKPTIVAPPNNGQPFEGQMVLKWRAGQRALKHIVHFGTTNPPPKVSDMPVNAQQPAAQYVVPEKVEAGVKYYWRIDQEGEGGLTEGDLWAFTAKAQPPPTKATPKNPPPNGDVVAGRVNLQWNPGQHAQEHVVFWSRDENVKELAKTRATTYAIPENLEAGATVYWRIDEIGPGGRTEGDVWMFHVIPPPPPPQQVHHGDKIVGRVLSWPGSQQVVLEDKSRKPDAPDLRVEVGEDLNKGILVFVHPDGVVTEESAPDGKTKLIFHPLGSTVQQGQELTFESQPRIYMEVQQLRQQAEGITQRPG